MANLAIGLIVQLAAGAESARPGKALLAVHIERVEPADGLVHFVDRLLRPRRGQPCLHLLALGAHDLKFRAQPANRSGFEHRHHDQQR